MFTKSDLAFLAARGTSVRRAEEQLKAFAEGFPYLKLDCAARVGRGIVCMDDRRADAAVAAWREYLTANHRVLKFVPASGAASRMFKDLFAFVEAPYDEPQSDSEVIFFHHIEFFAFFGELERRCLALHRKGVKELMAEGRYKDVARTLLASDGLAYGQLPKGLLLFHAYADETVRTPLEEHLVEGARYTANKAGVVHMHFTVSPEHHRLFEKKVKEVVRRYEHRFGVTYDITFSEQKPSTDTIAATPDGKPFRDDEGGLVFRPGGHGALIENLADIDADIVFVKNIDNIVPDRIKDETIHSKQMLAGTLVQLQQQAFAYLRKLDSGAYGEDDLREMLEFLENRFFCISPRFSPSAVSSDSRTALVDYLRGKLHRPMRVCGMVRNVGEPGGGPFMAYNADGTISPQILESSQIDKSNAVYVEMFRQGTHFNPVDLVCGVRDYNGQKFDLTKYVDKNTGFISSKSKDGRELLALELPGLWNGAMSDWLTLFVEVPLITFNPVKTVNDLLRNEHQMG
jgi:hypothetical protein